MDIHHQARSACAVMAIALMSPLVHATSVDRHDLEDLLHHAELVFAGEVVRIDHSEDRVGDDLLPFTFVTYEIEKLIKGSSEDGAVITLQMEGGPASNGLYLEIAGAPTFAVGDRDLLFVARNGEAIVPLVGWSQGRLRVTPSGLFGEHGEILEKRPSGELVLSASPAHDGHHGNDPGAASANHALPPAVALKLLEEAVQQQFTATELAAMRPSPSIGELRARHPVALVAGPPPSQAQDSAAPIAPQEARERLLSPHN